MSYTYDSVIIYMTSVLDKFAMCIVPITAFITAYMFLRVITRVLTPPLATTPEPIDWGRPFRRFWWWIKLVFVRLHYRFHVRSEPMKPLDRDDWEL